VALAAACSPGAVTVTPPTPPGSVEEQCAHLGDVLPASLEQLHSRVIEPKSPLTHAWGKPPITLRCGVGTPTGYSTTSSETTVVDDVSWFRQVGPDAVVWTAIRDGVNVALRVPTRYEVVGAYLVDLAPALKRGLP
jgi:hypothetical protein